MDKTVDNIKPFDFKDIYGFMKNSGKCFSTSAYKVLFSNVIENEYYYDYMFYKAKYMRCDQNDELLTSSFDYEKFLVKTINIVYENAKTYMDFESIINTNYYPEYLKLDIMVDYLKNATYNNTIDSFNTDVIYNIYNVLSKYNTPYINKIRKDFLYKVFCDIADSIGINIRCLYVNELITKWINDKYAQYVGQDNINFIYLISESQDELKSEIKNIMGFSFEIKVKVQKCINSIKNKTTKR